MDDKWNERFIKLAKEVATWSKENTQVGAVIVDIDTKKVLSTGFNGLPVSLNDDCLCVLEQSDKSVIVQHAEHNALEHLSKSDWNKNLAIYVTKTPCRLCAIKLAISHANIKELYYIPTEDKSFNERYGTSESLDYLRAQNIQVLELK